MSRAGRVAQGGGGPDDFGPFVRVFFAIVVVAAGASGAALLIAPGSTDRYFSWTLRPPAAAALIGGFYLAATAVFGWALTLPWRQARALMVGVLGLAVPTLVVTLVYDEVFDFGRWQAIAWVALFLTAPVSASAILARNRVDRAASPALRPGSRAMLGILAAALVVLAVLVWMDATHDDVARVGPVDLVRLTGAYLGAWCSFLAVLCGWAAARGTWDDARVPIVTVAAAAACALLAFVRSLGDIRHPVATLFVAAGVLIAAALTYTRNRPSRVVGTGS